MKYIVAAGVVSIALGFVGGLLLVGITQCRMVSYGSLVWSDINYTQVQCFGNYRLPKDTVDAR